MMHDSNFKISLTSLRIIHNLCSKYPKEIQNWLSNLVANLAEKLSDNKIVIRHAVLKVFYVLATTIGAVKIVGLIHPFLTHDNWHIREEVLSILIMSWITSNSTWGLSDPKILSQICQFVSDDKEKVSSAAFEALWLILSKDSSTAIILNSYLDPKVYNSVSERWLSKILATVNYDGIVEFPTPQPSNQNHLIYTSGYSHDQEADNTYDKDDLKKHTQSADHTSYSQSFHKQPAMSSEIKQNANYLTSATNFEQKTNSTTQSIGNKMWMPGFNMTASSIKSEQSVRIINDPVIQTPNQYINKMINDKRYDATVQSTVDKNFNYTPEVHQAMPRTFGSSDNPAMTTHSMNLALVKMNSMGGPGMRGHGSQIDSYNDNANTGNIPMMTDYNNRLSNKLIDDNNSDKYTASIDAMILSKGPIKPVPYAGVSAQSSLKSETIPSGLDNFDDDNMSDSRQHSNKSLESRNRNKNSMSQKKPPSK